MFIDFKNKKWQSVSRVLLILCLLSIFLALFFFDKDYAYNFQPDYYNYLNKIEFSLIFGLVLAILFTGAVSEEKYIFSISSVFLILLFFIISFPTLMYLENRHSLVYHFDSIFKKEISKDRIDIKLDKINSSNSWTTYLFQIKNENNIDSVYFSQNKNFVKVLNKNEVETLKVYRTIWRKRYILKEN